MAEVCEISSTHMGQVRKLLPPVMAGLRVSFGLFWGGLSCWLVRVLSNRIPFFDIDMLCLLGKKMLMGNIFRPKSSFRYLFLFP